MLFFQPLFSLIPQLSVKNQKFAAGCSRDVIRDGASRLGWELDTLMDKTLKAMAATEAQVSAELETLL